MKFPELFISNVSNIPGGITWLNELDNLILFFSQKWKLQKIETFKNLSFNYVAKAYSSTYKCDCVLKISLPTTEFEFEQKALSYFNGKGCVKLLNYDLTNYGFILECLKPGINLKSYFPQKENESIEITANLIKQLHKSPILQNQYQEFPKINSWLKIFDNFKDQKISKEIINRAKNLSNKLVSNQTDIFLLHADLHHENILQSNDVFKAIDPKGVIGDLSYEVGAFIRNPINELIVHPHAEKILKNRIKKFSELLNINDKRLLEIVFIQSVLAACWSIKDNNQSFQKWLKLINLL